MGTIVLALALVLQRTAVAKVSSPKLILGGSADSEGHQWGYVSKFGFYRGFGNYSFRVRVAGGQAVPAQAKEIELGFEIHLDEQWDDTERLPECQRVKQAKKTWPFTLPADGSWSRWINGTMKQTVRPHVWYFALRDCQQSLPSAIALDPYFHAFQEGGSEFSVELYGTHVVAIIKVLLGTLCLAWLFRASISSYQSTGQFHLIIAVLGTAALMQYLGYVCHLGHLLAYQADGRGIRVLDILGELCSMLSQILLTSLSIFLAKGYSVLPKEEVSLDVAGPVLAVIVASHLLITGVAKTRDDASFKFHENEGVCGFTLVLLRLALYAWFCTAMRCTYRNASLKLQPFILRFHIASALHYLSYPLLFLIASLLAPYLRHKFMLTGLFIMQALSLGWYSHMFFTRGDFFQISSLGANLLPTPQGSKKRPSLFRRDDGKQD